MAENTLLEKVLSLQDKYKKLEEQLADPAVIADMKKFVQLNKDYKELQPIIAAGLEYKRLVDELAQAKDILMNEKDDDLKEMAKDEIAQIEPQLPEMEQNIKLLLIPADPDDSKNAMVEIRGGTGGDEAAIFAGDLFRMYQHFAERRGWKLEVSDQTPGTSGGFKQIVFKLSSSTDGVYGVMKYESGVHRVQRVPQTETQGRIQTSAASVAVFPEAGEFDIELNPADIRKDLLGEHHLQRRSPHPHSFRYCGAVSGGTFPAQEPGPCHGGAPYPPVQHGAPEIPGRHCRQAQDDGKHRRPQCQNPHLQLSAGPCDRPPHWLEHVQPAGVHGR